MTFDNPDGLTEVAFTKFDNFTLTNGQIDPVPSDITMTDGRPTVAFSDAPEHVEMTLRQANADVPDAAYFAIASSRCRFAEEGLLETDFDSLVQFEATRRRRAGGARAGRGLPKSGTRTGYDPHGSAQRGRRHAVGLRVMGRRVAILVQTTLPAGTHEVQWNGHSDGGARLASGVYLIRLAADGQVRTGRLTIVR